MNSTMIFCTCASAKAGIYLRRIVAWAEQFASLPDVDLHVFCDGLVLPPEELADTHFHCFIPALGRAGEDSSIFPGWKRSFHRALIVGQRYGHVAHVENDVRILNLGKFREHLTRPLFASGHTARYGFMETALMILNDRVANRALIEYLSIDANLREDLRAEHMIQKIAPPIHVFHGERHEGHDERILPGHDYIAQYDPEATSR